MSNSYDPDLFDLEVMAERMPVQSCTVQELADLLGVTRSTIFKGMHYGRIPLPAETTSKGWQLFTADQVHHIITSRAVRPYRRERNA